MMGGLGVCHSMTGHLTLDQGIPSWFSDQGHGGCQQDVSRIPVKVIVERRGSFFWVKEVTRGLVSSNGIADRDQPEAVLAVR